MSKEEEIKIKGINPDINDINSGDQVGDEDYSDGLDDLFEGDKGEEEGEGEADEGEEEADEGEEEADEGEEEGEEETDESDESEEKDEEKEEDDVELPANAKSKTKESFDKIKEQRNEARKELDQLRAQLKDYEEGRVESGEKAELENLRKIHADVLIDRKINEHVNEVLTDDVVENLKVNGVALKQEAIDFLRDPNTDGETRAAYFSKIAERLKSDKPILAKKFSKAADAIIDTLEEKSKIDTTKPITLTGDVKEVVKSRVETFKKSVAELSKDYPLWGMVEIPKDADADTKKAMERHNEIFEKVGKQRIFQALAAQKPEDFAELAVRSASYDMLSERYNVLVEQLKTAREENKKLSGRFGKVKAAGKAPKAHRQEKAGKVTKMPDLDMDHADALDDIFKDVLGG